MKLGKKILALLMAVLLLTAMAPAANATEVTEEPEYTGEQARTYYVELRRQVAIGNGLNEYEYTKESWKPLAEALEIGNRYVKESWGQKTILDAAKAIEVAVAGLVRMDYAQLDRALANTHKEIEKNPELYSVCARLLAAAEKASSSSPFMHCIHFFDGLKEQRDSLKPQHSCLNPSLIRESSVKS